MNARTVDPETIVARVEGMPGVEVQVCNRPAGSVDLPAGYREHVLIWSHGEAAPGWAARSALRAEGIARDWSEVPCGEVSTLPAGFAFRWEWNYRSRSTHIAPSRAGS